MKKILVAALLIQGGSLYAQDNAKPVVMATNTEMLAPLPAQKPLQQINFTSKAFPLSNKTWGYEIMADGEVLLRQQDMPGKAKGIGFGSRQDAEKVAAAVIDLVKNPVRPPAIFVTDLQKMNIK